MRLSPLMRAALEDACRHVEGLRRTFEPLPGQPSWPHPPGSLAALVRHGLLETRELRNRKGYRVQAWFVTEAGRKALEPVLVVKADAPLYPAPGGGYTSNPKRSIDKDEIVNLDGKTVLVAVEAARGRVDPAWRENAERNRRRDRAAVNAGRLSGLSSPEERLAELKRMAAERGMDIRGDLRQLEHVVRRIERKVTENGEEAA